MKNTPPASKLENTDKMAEENVENLPIEDADLDEGDLQAVQHLKDAYSQIREELSNVIVGMDTVIEQVLTTIFARGHCLLVGVPGLAKTLLISTLARALDMSFNRIQFTPDLMPSDITGTEVIQEDKRSGERLFKFLPGPIFSNVILADEINRTPPKTQAALLEAMQERQVTAGGKRYPLDPPFFVLATQNPIEQEGTYPLPEAQLDRFMFNIFVDYPTEDEEFEIMVKTTGAIEGKVEKILSKEDILRLQKIVRRVPIADHIVEYSMDLVRATRLNTPEAPKFIKDWLTWGAGPRACQYLCLGGKARAILKGRYYVSSEDIREVAHPVLRHRIITNFNAEAEGITSNSVIEMLLKHIPCNEPSGLRGAKIPKIFDFK